MEEDKKITDVNELIEQLQSCSIASESCYLETMKRIDIHIREWENMFSYKETGPARILLFENDDFQLFISCWERDQKGEIHDINLSEAFIHPICGTLVEEGFRIVSNGRLEQVSSVKLGTGCYSYMNRSHNQTIYRHKNCFDQRSSMIQLYTKPVKEWNIYDLDGNKRKVAHIFDKEIEHSIK